jgi:hypothetical protein
MLWISFRDGSMGRSGAVRKRHSENIKVDGRYYNGGSGTVVWTGYFTGRGQEMNLCHDENVSGWMDVDVRAPDGSRAPLRCAVYPGCNNFVVIEGGGEK